MPEPLEPEKCPKCQLAVYDAEGFPAGKHVTGKSGWWKHFTEKSGWWLLCNSL